MVHFLFSIFFSTSLSSPLSWRTHAHAGVLRVWRRKGGQQALFHVRLSWHISADSILHETMSIRRRSQVNRAATYKGIVLYALGIVLYM